MTAIISHQEAHAAILSVYVSAASFFSGGQNKDSFQRIMTTPVDPEKFSQFFELCYAERENLPEDVKEAAISVGRFAATLGFYELGIDGRGLLMAQAMESGGDGPEPLAAYKPRPPVLDEAVPVPLDPPMPLEGEE